MAKVSFLKSGMEIGAEYMRGGYSLGDPLPVGLVQSAQSAWKNRMGWEDDIRVAAGKAWDQVRIGPQTFSAKQFLEAEKTFTPGNTREGAVTLKKHEPPIKLKAPDSVPDWNLDAKNAFRATLAHNDEATELTFHDEVPDSAPDWGIDATHAFRATLAHNDEAPELTPDDKALDRAPDWGLDATHPFRATLTFHDEAPQAAGPIYTPSGDVDFNATQERDLAEALKKIGAKPRPPKHDL